MMTDEGMNNFSIERFSFLLFMILKFRKQDNE